MKRPAPHPSSPGFSTLSYPTLHQNEYHLNSSSTLLPYPLLPAKKSYRHGVETPVVSQESGARLGYPDVDKHGWRLQIEGCFALLGWKRTATTKATRKQQQQVAAVHIIKGKTTAARHVLQTREEPRTHGGHTHGQRQTNLNTYTQPGLQKTAACGAGRSPSLHHPSV